MEPTKGTRRRLIPALCRLISVFVILSCKIFANADEEARWKSRASQGVEIGVFDDILRVTTIVVSRKNHGCLFNSQYSKLSHFGFEQEYPYLTLKPNFESLIGNDRFEGYCKEVLDLLATELGFQCKRIWACNSSDEHPSAVTWISDELHLVTDSQFGSMDERGQWRGMIGELLRDVSSLV